MAATCCLYKYVHNGGGLSSLPNSSSSSSRSTTMTMTTTTTTTTTTTMTMTKRRRMMMMMSRPPPPPLICFQISCCSSTSDSDSKSAAGRGFSTKKNQSNNSSTPRPRRSSRRESTSQQSPTLPTQARALNPQKDAQSKNIAFDVQFEERLKAVRRSALDQKKAEEKKDYGAIDYDAPVDSKSKTIGLGTKIGVGVAVVVFGLVFALGDFLPSVSTITNKEASEPRNAIPQEEKIKLQTRLQQYEATLSMSPEDPTAIEGAAVTLTELGDYTRAASLLESLMKKKPSDPDVFRLLGEVKYELKDYDGSAAAYRSCAMVSQNMDFEILRGLSNALLGAQKPDEAVKVILSTRESLNTKAKQDNSGADDSVADTKLQSDPIQVELLLGKAYSDWGHVSDAVSVYDQLISSHPDDFRGYLAKVRDKQRVLRAPLQSPYKTEPVVKFGCPSESPHANRLTGATRHLCRREDHFLGTIFFMGIILKENGKIGDAERMFIQARFFAPQGAKALVDRYSGQ